MSAAPLLTSSVVLEPPRWVVVPGDVEVGDDWYNAALELFAAVARVDDDLSNGDELFVHGPAVDAVAALDSLLEFRAALGEGDRLVANLAVPKRWPLPVVVSVGVVEAAAGELPDLLTLAGAHDGLPVEHPIVEELPEDVRGTGPMVTRFDLDDDGAIWATCCAVRRERFECADDVAVVDTRVLWRTNDLEVVPVFGPELVTLVSAIKNEVRS